MELEDHWTFTNLKFFQVCMCCSLEDVELLIFTRCCAWRERPTTL